MRIITILLPYLLLVTVKSEIDEGICLLPSYPGLSVTPFKRLYKIDEPFNISCEENYTQTTVVDVTTMITCEKIIENYWIRFDSELKWACLPNEYECLYPKKPDDFEIETMKSTYDIEENVALTCEIKIEFPDPQGHNVVNWYLETGGCKWPPPENRASPNHSDMLACEDLCPPPVQSGLVITPFKRWYKIGETIELACQDRFILNSNNLRSICERQERFPYAIGFHGIRQLCKRTPTCTPPTEIGLEIKPFKQSYKIGETITLSCMKHFELTFNQPMEQTCTKGMKRPLFYYNDEEPICKKIIKCAPPNKDGLVITPFKSMYEIGENYSLSCMEGYNSKFDLPIVHTCKEVGHYEQKLPDCKRIQNCKVPSFENLIVKPFKRVYKPGEEITLECDREDYIIILEDTKAICRPDGKFNASVFELYKKLNPDRTFLDRDQVLNEGSPCQKHTSEMEWCSPYARKNMYITPKKSKYLYGEQVQLSCAPGYELTEESLATCRFVPRYTTTCRGDFLFQGGITKFNIGRRPCKKYSI